MRFGESPVRAKCTMCGLLCEVLPSLPVPTPDNFGVWISHERVCCAACARDIAGTFARRCRVTPKSGGKP
jgi:hypothetical protein